MSANYEEHFTAFVDFLGFREAAQQSDETQRAGLLQLLRSLSLLQGEFSATKNVDEHGTTHYIKPAISTFSDHIVISFPLSTLSLEAGLTEDDDPSFFVVYQFQQLLGNLAAAALKIGFLIRGGVTIGNLYHSQGVVFGPAMVEAYELESRTAVYPRIVASHTIMSRPKWINNSLVFLKDDDGLYCVDYYRPLLFRTPELGAAYNAELKNWFRDSTSIIQKNMNYLRSAGKLNELAKWTALARYYRASLSSVPTGTRDAFGLSLNDIPWR